MDFVVREYEKSRFIFLISPSAFDTQSSISVEVPSVATLSRILDIKSAPVSRLITEYLQKQETAASWGSLGIEFWIGEPVNDFVRFTDTTVLNGLLKRFVCASARNLATWIQHQTAEIRNARNTQRTVNF